MGANSEELSRSTLPCNSKSTSPKRKFGDKVRLLERDHVRVKSFGSLFLRLPGDFRGNGDEERSDSSVGDFSTAAQPVASTTPPMAMGWVTGVFSPVSLSMFSSLLFLRVGYIVGNVGLTYSVVMLVVAYAILGLTILSICAIATNGAVEGGGVYFMISRTLGPELGGSIGVLFWAANTVGSALFATGCVEAVLTMIGPQGMIYPLIPKTNYGIEFGFNLCVLCFTTIVSILGPSLFGRMILLLLLTVVVCISTVFWSFFGFFTHKSFDHIYNDTVPSNCTTNCSYVESVGSFVSLIQHNRRLPSGFVSVMMDDEFATYARDCQVATNIVTPFTVFGVLFAGVTGILAGANLSGELKNPSEAIPKGTIIGTAFTFVVYLGLFILTAATCNRSLLYHECLYMYYLDFWGPFVAIGTACATLCASLSCLLGASRVIHAVAKDNMFGETFRRFDKEFRGNPIVSVLFTSGVVCLLMLYGSLNAISQLCSVLYLISYASINVSCFFLDAFSSPNFRPTFKLFHCIFSLVGFLLTVVGMFLINYVYALVCICGCSVITFILAYFSPGVSDKNWGSFTQNLLLHQVRKYLLKLDSRKYHVKYWRPHILYLVKNPRCNRYLIHFMNAMKKGGLFIMGHVELGDFDVMEREPQSRHWIDLVDDLKVKAFVEQTVAKSFRDGAHHLVRISGVGAIKPNTVCLGFPRAYDYENRGDLKLGFRNNREANLERFSSFPEAVASNGQEGNVDGEKDTLEYVQTLSDILKIGKNVCVCRNFDDRIEDSDNGSQLFVMTALRKTLSFFLPTKSVEKYGGRKRKYIDVWLVNFFSQPNANTVVQDKIGYLFMLQLAYVVSISRTFKDKVKLRVVVRTTKSDPRGSAVIRQRLKELLLSERIKAEEDEVDFDYDLEELPLGVTGLGRSPHRVWTDGTNRVSTEHILTTANGVIKEKSTNTIVTFLPLPRPPSKSSMARPSSATSSSPLPSSDDASTSFAFVGEDDETEDPRQRYVGLLEILTRDLPPTVLVHGIHAVTCTQL